MANKNNFYLNDIEKLDRNKAMHFGFSCTKTMIENLPIENTTATVCLKCIEAMALFIDNSICKKRLLESAEELYNYYSIYYRKDPFYEPKHEIICVLHAVYSCLGDESVFAYDIKTCWSQFAISCIKNNKEHLIHEQIRYFEELLNFDSLVENTLLGGLNE